MLAVRSSTWAWTWKRFMLGSKRLVGSAAAGCSSGFDGARSALAAVVGQVAEHTVHLVVGGAVDERPARALDRHEAGHGQLLQVEGQRRRGDATRLLHHPGVQAARPGDDKRLKHLKAQRMGQRAEGLDDLVFL